MLAPLTQRPTGAPSSILPPKIQRPVSLQRRSTLKRSIDETSAMDVPSSPSKRSRVTFDSEVEILSADDEDDLSLDVVTEQVRRALQRHKNGDHTSYDSITGIFTASAERDATPSTRTIRKHLTAVLANIASLTKECTGLVDAVLFSEWIGRDDSYFALFVRFLSNLAAAHRGHQSKIMEMLVDLLGPQKTRRLTNEKPVRQRKIHKRVLQTLQHLTRNVPSAASALASRLGSRLDFDFAKPNDRITFIRSYMLMINYVPDLTSDILACIMRELIKLDVCVQDGLDDGEDLEDELVQHLSSSQTLLARSSQRTLTSSEDDEDLSTTDDSDTDDLIDEDPITARYRKLREDAKQVDQIMDILFSYYDPIINSSNLQIRHNAIERLINQFQTFILPTYRSRHPQFLLFHFAQTDPIIVDRFIADCVQILMDKSQPTILRHSAAAYFSGFVGRGGHVPHDLVRDCLELLCEHLNDLRQTYAPLCTRGPDLRRFGDFYATFQAILYIFCFRWRDVAMASSDLEDHDDDMFASGPQQETYQIPDTLTEALSSAIYSPLNPLRVCTPEIVEQFAKLSTALQMLFIYPKIELNKHVRIATGWRSMSDLSISDPSRDMSWLGDNGMIEGYFPFDPYSLPRSKRWIDGDYVAWRGIPGEEREDSDDEEMEAEEDLEEEGDEVDEERVE